MENPFCHSIDSTLPTVCSRTDHPNFGNLHGFSLWSFLSSVFTPTPLFFLSLCSLLTPGFPLVFLTIMPSIFADVYNEAPGIAGLHYFALGIGLTTASQLNARFLDRIYIYYKNKKGGVGQPEFRLRELSPRCGWGYWWWLIPNLLFSDDGSCKYCPSCWTDSCRMGGTTSFALDSNWHRALIFF